ncbi:putative DnaJ domain-containing protein [Lupinus albus]|uniref:Putative DnaJ domain-containing protein n=1 Tax=Lupinus albus TaxID=3870 RepID=A0A6A4P166_LUPAL|nr:putative DnaJ domain-containing protein [Lupinus albus]
MIDLQKMSNAIKSAALFNSLTNNNNNIILSRSIRVSLFHSTPILERKRRNSWDSRCNNYSRRFRRMHGKQKLMRSVNDYADFLFQSWKEGIDGDDPSSSRDTSWFKKQYSAKDPGTGRYRSSNQGSSPRYKRDPFFCEDDFDVETILRSAFGGNRFTYWSFINDENPQWKRSGRFSNYERSWNWRHRSESDSDSSSESNSSDSYLVPDRLALGLSASGPLKLEDVKNAYRSCALKWHPDRHHGSSKAIAEEKFKLCSAAYQSICDKLALD